MQAADSSVPRRKGHIVLNEQILNAGGLKNVRPVPLLEPAAIVGEAFGRDQFDVRNCGFRDLHDCCPKDDD